MKRLSFSPDKTNFRVRVSIFLLREGKLLVKTPGYVWVKDVSLLQGREQAKQWRFLSYVPHHWERKVRIKKMLHRRILEEKTGWCNVLTSFIPFDDYGVEVNHHIWLCSIMVYYGSLSRIKSEFNSPHSRFLSVWCNGQHRCLPHI